MTTRFSRRQTTILLGLLVPLAALSAGSTGAAVGAPVPAVITARTEQPRRDNPNVIWSDRLTGRPNHLSARTPLTAR